MADDNSAPLLFGCLLLSILVVPRAQVGSDKQVQMHIGSTGLALQPPVKKVKRSVGNTTKGSTVNLGREVENE